MRHKNKQPAWTKHIHLQYIIYCTC